MGLCRVTRNNAIITRRLGCNRRGEAQQLSLAQPLIAETYAEVNMGVQRLYDNYTVIIDEITNKCAARLDNLKKGIEEEIFLSSLKSKLIETGRMKRRGSEVILEELRSIPRKDREWFK